MAAQPLSKDDQLRAMRAMMAESKANENVWDKAWVNSLTPWDAAAPQPALLELVQDPKTSGLLPKSGRALVPGCGRGYDVELLARRGLNAVGADISPTAVSKAKEWLATQAALPSGAGSVRFAEADFFKLGQGDEGGPAGQEPVGSGFALVYDYTFFCALPPSLRTAWAAQMASLILPRGVLIALVYPIHGDRQGGPPFSVSPEIYEQLLSPNFELLHSAAPSNPPEHRKGIEMIQVWQRR